MTNDAILELYLRYARGWTAITSTQRTALMLEIAEDDFTYMTHKYVGAGTREAIGDMEAFQSRYPGGVAAVEDISAHHNVALLSWVMSAADGSQLITGKDQITLSPRRRLAGLTMFEAATPI